MPRTVIDADGHVGEPKDMFETYLDVPIGNRRPYVTKDDFGIDRWVIEGKLFPVPEGYGIGPKSRYDVFRPGMLDPRARLQDMDAEGIHAAAIFPSIANAFGWGIENPDLGVACCRTYNNFILDYCSADPERLKAIAVMPLQDPSAAAEEARRCVARGAIALHVGPQFRNVGLHEPRFTPIFRTAQELDVPIMVHASTGPHISPAAGTTRYNKFFFTHMVCHPFEQMLAMLSIIGGGLLEEFPRLRVGFFEAGAGYVPYWLERMDEHYEGYSKDATPMQMAPSEYFQRQCWVSCEPDERELPHAIDVLGAEKIVFATDYHHFDAVFPGVVAKLADRTDISEAVKDVLFERGARALLNLAPTGAATAAATGS